VRNQTQPKTRTFANTILNIFCTLMLALVLQNTKLAFIARANRRACELGGMSDQ